MVHTHAIDRLKTLVHDAADKQRELLLSPNDAQILATLLDDIKPSQRVQQHTALSIEMERAELAYDEANQHDEHITINTSGSKTLGEILQSDALGGWSHRTDIVDSVSFAMELRRKAESRTLDD